MKRGIFELYKYDNSIINLNRRARKIIFFRAQEARNFGPVRVHTIRNTGVLGVTSTPGFWGKMKYFQEKLGAKWQIYEKFGAK